MPDQFIFYPQRRPGLLFGAGAIGVLLVVALLGLWQASIANAGPLFLFALLPVVGAAVIIPILSYRLYALQNSAYSLEREGIRLRWGLRIEDIPMDAVLWIQPASELEVDLPLPSVRWPGALLGVQNLNSGETLEYLAAGRQGLTLIATPGRLFAISPADPPGFLRAYGRLTEFGVLAPLAGHSVYPSILLKQVWDSWLARSLLLTSIILMLLHLTWVSLAIPGRDQVALGFSGTRRDLVPAVRLLLLPLLNFFFLVIDFAAGLFFFRRSQSRVYTYLLWISSVITSLFFLAGVYFILRQ